MRAEQKFRLEGETRAAKLVFNVVQTCTKPLADTELRLYLESGDGDGVTAGGFSTVVRKFAGSGWRVVRLHSEAALTGHAFGKGVRGAHSKI